MIPIPTKMTVESHTFDPDGDLLLLLSRPAEPTSTQSDEANDSTATDAVDTNGMDALEGNANAAAEGQTEATETPKDTETSPNAPSTDPSNGLEDSEKAEAKEPDIEVHMLVSAKHMMLASPVFRAMLRLDNFKEGKTLHSTGKVEVSLPDDDPVAFIVLLNIIHGRTREVPRTIELKLLASISILVDKYQMQEVVEMYSDTWIEDLKGSIPTDYSESAATTIMTWLGIAWVFRKAEQFKQLTLFVEQEGDDRVEEDIEQGTPIPDPVIGRQPFVKSACNVSNV